VSNNNSSLPSTYEPFPVDLEHLMDNIKDQYVNLTIEQAIIVENVDNCIDERYSEVHFNKQAEGVFEILMLGDAMNQKVFTSILPKIAATTKIPGKKIGALGRYGWGMKVCMCVADSIIVETKCEGFHSAQSWKLIGGIPHRKREEAKKTMTDDFTLITVKLSSEYSKIVTLDFIVRTLQEFYPTILNGAPVINRYGETRVLKMYLNSRAVSPPPKIDYEKKKALVIKIGGQKATGYVYLSKEILERENTGIAIIVHGRKIMHDFFGTHGSMDVKIAGYIHADMLIESLAGDKTSLRRNSLYWRQLSENAAKQLSKFMEEIGALREERLPKKIIRRVHEEINNLVKNFPELQELARKAGISLSHTTEVEVLMPKKDGNILSELEEGSDRTRGLKSGIEGGKGVPIGVGRESVQSPSEKEGESSAVKVKRRRKRGLEIYARPEPDVKREAWFSPEGVIIVNSSFPTYEKADKMHSLEYHMERCAIDALLSYAVETEVIDKENAEIYRHEVFAKWGEL
jgi:hypothetical protein